MKEIADVLAAEGQTRAERIAARKIFLKRRSAIWKATTPSGQTTSVNRKRK